MTINEIAEMAGVSRATVSRYLNNGYVSAAKKERIAAVIEKTGFTPSVSAKLLRSNRSNLIGVIIPKIDSDSISRMVSGISEVLNERGMQLLLACTNNHEEDELKYLKTFRENHVDGIILFGTIFTAEHMKVLKDLNTPLVILSQKLDGYSCIYSDDYHAARNLAEAVIDSARNVGLIMVSDQDIAVGLHRRTGISDVFEEHGRPIAPEHIVRAQFSMESGYQACKELLEKNADIDTILCATDTIALGALRYLHEVGKAIPTEVQVAAFNDNKISSAITPALSTVHFYYEESGREAASILLSKIENPENDVNKELQLQYDVMLRETTR